MGDTVKSGSRQSGTDAPDAVLDTDAGDSVMTALRSHVPLTLLMDLTDPQGPHSAEISEAEGGEADWLPDTEEAAAPAEHPNAPAPA